MLQTQSNDSRISQKLFLSILEAKKPIVSALVHESQEVLSAKFHGDNLAFHDEDVLRIAESALGTCTLGMNALQLAIFVLHNNYDKDDSLESIRKDIVDFLMEVNSPLNY